MDKSKKRSTNFSKEEELGLLQEIEKYKDIVECKTTNKVNNKEKEEAWQKILTNFNAKNVVWRTVEQVKNKYDNIKTRTRKVVAKENSYLRGTGGGPEIKTLEDPVIEATLRIINEKTVVGLKTIFDSDETIKTNYVWENIPSTSEEKIPDKLRKKPKTEEKTNWSTYVPTNLQTPKNKKLLPTIRNPVFSAKERYYRRKYRLLLRTFKAEEEERRKRMEREQKNYKAEEEGRKIKEEREKNIYEKKCKINGFRHTIKTKTIGENE
ncbi:unnamed protein product [Diabrotica balteata]|uniref:Regulatory protein zeste n=1 Tax=Diabrotica balteata TaxID=107213 RepID=A0A9N9XEM1_DIABA|nr:unnamed protein product [Diabrotica balteata]